MWSVVCLFYPQTYYQMHGGYSEVYGQSIKVKLRTSTIRIVIIQNHSNLPVVHNSYLSEKAKRGLGPLMQSGLCQMCYLLWISLGKLTWSSLPLLPNQSNLSFLVSHVSVIQRTSICHPLRGSYFCGIGNLVSICIRSRNSCLSIRMSNLSANALFCLL